MTTNPAPWSQDAADELSRRVSACRPVCALTVDGVRRRFVQTSVDLDGYRDTYMTVTGVVRAASQAEALTLGDPRRLQAAELWAGYTWPATRTTDLQRMALLQPVRRSVVRNPAGGWEVTMTLATPDTYLDADSPAGYGRDGDVNNFVRKLLTANGQPLGAYPVVGALPAGTYGDDAEPVVPLGANLLRGLRQVAETVNGQLFHDGTSWVLRAAPAIDQAGDVLTLGTGADVVRLAVDDLRPITELTLFARSAGGKEYRYTARLDDQIAISGRTARTMELNQPISALLPFWDLTRARLARLNRGGKVLSVTARSRWWLRPGHTVNVPGIGRALVVAVRHDSATATMAVDLES